MRRASASRRRTAKLVGRALGMEDIVTMGDAPIGWLVLLIVLFAGVFFWSLRTGRRNRDNAPDLDKDK